MGNCQNICQNNQEKHESQIVNQSHVPISKNKKETEQQHEEIEEIEEVSCHSDEEDDYVDDVQQQKNDNKMKQNYKQRQSVSAEAFGAFNQKKKFKPRIIQKTENQIERIRNRLNQAFMFQALDENETQTILYAFEEKKFSEGEYVIRQGEEGSELYVVDQGQLDCYKVFQKGGKDTFLKTYQPGESFGELALLYNAPRAASIKAKTECVLFALDRDCFNNIVKDAAQKRRDRFESVLEKIDLLASMDPYERSQIADALKQERFSAGDFVIRQGEKGEKFYMIQTGELVALKQIKPNEPIQEVFQYSEGGYFGELALLNNKPRQASIQCRTNVILVSLDRDSFKRLLGPLDDILKRNQDKYAKYM